MYSKDEIFRYYSLILKWKFTPYIDPTRSLKITDGCHAW